MMTAPFSASVWRIDMKRRFGILNGILLAVNLVLMVRYRMEGGIVMKGIASA